MRGEEGEGRGGKRGGEGRGGLSGNVAEQDFCLKSAPDPPWDFIPAHGVKNVITVCGYRAEKEV